MTANNNVVVIDLMCESFLALCILMKICYWFTEKIDGDTLNLSVFFPLSTKTTLIVFLLSKKTRTQKRLLPPPSFLFLAVSNIVPLL